MLGCVLAAVAILWAHHPRGTPAGALAILATGLACAGLAVLRGIRALRTIWRTGESGAGRVLFGLLVAVATLAYPAYLAALAIGRPLSAAATTDAAAPPRFSRSAKAFALRGRLDPPAPDVAEKPILVELDPADTHATLGRVLTDLHWRVVDSVPPGGRLGLGHIDAVTYSPVMHLPQDIAIRLTPFAGHTRIDVRSSTRLGLYDFGESRATIRQLAAALEAADGE